MLEIVVVGMEYKCFRFMIFEVFSFKWFSILFDVLKCKNCKLFDDRKS